MEMYWLAMFFGPGIVHVLPIVALLLMCSVQFTRNKGAKVVRKCFHISWIEVHRWEGNASQIQDRL